MGILFGCRPEQFERCNSELLSAVREIEWKTLDAPADEQ
eukprot:SAG22_NODE_5898_length_934_cov_1.598802_1_plen_38_part_01